MDISQTPLEVFEELKALRDSLVSSMASSEDMVDSGVRQNLKLELFKALIYQIKVSDARVEFDYWSKRLGLE